MSGKLSNLNIGPLKIVETRKPKPQTPSTVSSTQPSVKTQVLAIPQELQIIAQIPGSGPYLTVDLLPDTVFLLQYEGSKAFLETLPKDENGNIVVGNLEPIKPNALLQTLVNQTWEMFLTSLYPYTQLQPSEIQTRIYNEGIQPLSILFAQTTQSDYSSQVAQGIPSNQITQVRNPTLLVFEHSSQDIHVKTQKIEIEIIKNEPEVVERDDIQCACGSKRVRAVPVQIRRADEPPTIFAQCVKCKLRWNFSSA